MPANTTPRRASVKGQPAVELDLDAYAAETAPEQPVPFRLQGKTFRLVNPMDLDWQVIVAIQEGKLQSLAVQSMLHPDDLDEFLKLTVTGRTLRQLESFYRERFGDQLGEAGA